MKTLRQQMIALLSDNPMDLVALSQALGIHERQVVDHLPHIAKSLIARGAKLDVQAAWCEACGYTFKDRKRLTPPSRCPRCKQSRILGPWYEVCGIKNPEGSKQLC